MIFRTVVITAATANPVTDAEAQAYLRDLDAANLPLIQTLVKAATNSIQQELIAYQIMQTTFELQMDGWYSDTVTTASAVTFSGTPSPMAGVTLPKNPLVAIVQVTYDDVTGTPQTLAPSNYYIDSASRPGRLVWSNSASLPGLGPKPNCVRIQYTAGHGVAGDTVTNQQAASPATLKAAILMRLGSFYENRQEEGNNIRIERYQIGVERLIAPYRIPV